LILPDPPHPTLQSTMRVLAAPHARSFARALSTTAPRRQVYDSILDTIGGTPVVRINRLAPANVEMYVKCEYFNPLSSVKDRMAYSIIMAAEKSGQLKAGDTVVEATSGNTGIALAMVCAARGYKCVLTMADSFSIERRQVMRALGAKVVLTPAKLGGVGMVRKAEELAEKHGFVLARQFENEANPAYHSATTGPEILQDFANRRLDYWVSGYGTGGTVTGVGKVLKAARPDVKIILAEPAAAPLVMSGKPQERLPNNAPAGPHPAWTGPHPIQGWTPMFIPHNLQHTLDHKFAEEILPVTGEDAMRAARDLASKEGIFTGTSGGASFSVALDVAKKAPDGSVILAMLADTMERYLSTPLVSNIPIEMDEEEVAYSNSTPHARYE